MRNIVLFCAVFFMLTPLFAKPVSKPAKCDKDESFTLWYYVGNKRKLLCVLCGEKKPGPYLKDALDCHKKHRMVTKRNECILRVSKKHCKK